MNNLSAQSNAKGIMFAFGNSFFVSLVFIFSRIIQDTMAIPTFLFWWFGFASVWAMVILVFKRRELGFYFINIKNHPLFLVYFVISESLGAFLFFYLVSRVNPAIISFLFSLTPLFVVIIAFFYIKERLNKIELMGGAISIAGVVVITYVSPEVPFADFFLIMALVLLYSFNNVVVRKKVQDISPLLITILRIFSLFTLFTFYVMIQGGWRLPNLKEALCLTAGSLSGPIFGLFMLFSALRHARATTVSLIKNSSPFMVALLAAPILNIPLTLEQLLGGTIIILGISVLLSEKKINKIKKKIFRFTCLFLLLILPVTSFSQDIFKEEVFPESEVIFHEKDMAKQIREVLYYFDQFKDRDSHTRGPDLFSHLGVTTEHVMNTLEFIYRVIREDLLLGRPSRLKDPGFIDEHFRVIRWRPSPGHRGNGDKIRVTRYAVFTFKGSAKKTRECPYALYGLPHDEAGLTLEQAWARKDRLSRFKYTRQQVMAGAYDRGGAEALVWLSGRGLQEAIMQGTIAVKVKGRPLIYYNVNRSNGIPFDPAILNPFKQPRYWYFSQVDHPRGYGLDVQSMVRIYPYCALAGDLANLGFGKLVMLSYRAKNKNRREARLGILADTGGAFRPNLNQLDCYTGVVGSPGQLQLELAKMPEYTGVFFLIKKNMILNNKKVHR